jgi:hypothetical protein
MNWKPATPPHVAVGVEAVVAVVRLLDVLDALDEVEHIDAEQIDKPAICERIEKHISTYAARFAEIVYDGDGAWLKNKDCEPFIRRYSGSPYLLIYTKLTDGSTENIATFEIRGVA